MSYPGFAIGAQMAEERQREREQRAEEQRQAQLEVIRNAGLTPEAQADAVRTLYQRDPSALRQHVENLTGRLVGRKPQPTPMAYAPQSTTTQPAPMTIGGMTIPAPRPVTVSYPGARTQAERRDQDLSGGRTQQQQTVDLYNAETGAQQDAQLAGTQKLFDWYQSLPPEQQRTAGPMLGIAPRGTWKEFTGPNGERQYFDLNDPQQIPPGWNATGGAVKPQMRTLQGHLVLVDPFSGKKLRDLGPVGTARITRRQTMQPGDDGQMHLVTLTSITTPDGASIDVEPDAPAPDAGGGGAPAPATTKGPAPRVPAKNAPQVTAQSGKGPAPRAGGTSSGPVVPGFSTLARSKNPVFKSDVAAYTKLNEDANTKEEAYRSAQGALASGSTPSSDQELIYSWVRSNVQGAGRMTQAEFRQAASVGSLPERAQIAWEKLKSGKLPTEIEQMFLADIQRSAQVARQAANDAKAQLQAPAAPAPGTAPVVAPTQPPAASGFNWEKYPQ
ncbi:MAG: hypothetical protein WA294_14080 [Acidobacteriaceae bacterium]